MLEIKSSNSRTYIRDRMIPILTEGLIEVCKKIPEDPVDFLAEYLFKRSLEIINPDPSIY